MGSRFADRRLRHGAHHGYCSALGRRGAAGEATAGPARGSAPARGWRPHAVPAGYSGNGAGRRARTDRAPRRRRTRSAARSLVLTRPLPADVYLDTSVVVAAIIAGTPHSAASSAFCLSLAEQGSRVYFSQLLRLEYGEAIRRLVRRDQLPEDLRLRYDLARWDADVAVRRRWMRF